MDWQVSAKQIEVDDFREIEISEVLYDFDGPRIFTAQTGLGELLFYLADEQGGLCRHIAVPTSQQIIKKLKTGILSVRQALDQPWVWVVDSNYDGTPVSAWQGSLADVPNDALPEAGVMLLPELDPLFTLRAIGDGLSEGHVPVSVVRQVIDGAMTALKKISIQAFSATGARGRKSNMLRQFYDLPAQGFAYNSFEVSFRFPGHKQANIGEGLDGGEWDSGYEEVGKNLIQALEWAIKPESDESTSLDSINLLEALEKLVPPQRGVVNAVEIRGRLLSGGQRHYQLTRQASKKVRRALDVARLAREKLSKVTGLVREFDKDNCSFTLRNTDDDKEHLCTFQPELYDDILEAFDCDLRIVVAGRENLGTGEIDVVLVTRTDLDTATGLSDGGSMLG